MSFDDLAARALDTAGTRGAEYADVRFEVVRSERIETRNGVVTTLSDSTSRGYGMRALYGGAWGFAAGSDLTQAGIDRTAARAVDAGVKDVSKISAMCKVFATDTAMTAATSRTSRFTVIPSHGLSVRGDWR